MAISPARISAFDILLKIETADGFSSDLTAEQSEGLDDRDRSLSHELVLGSLRRQIYLDRIIALLSNGKKLDAEVRIALRMGLYQLLHLDRVPDYSAINESVDLVARFGKRSAKGFVNAVLRRATRGPVEPDYVDEIDRISVDTSHPRWLVEKWISQFGPDETVKLADANNEKPNVAFRETAINSEGPAGLARWGDNIRQSIYVEGCFFSDQMSTELREAEARSEIYFQDEASQMVAQLITLTQHRRFIDVCASPGSKTSLIAARNMQRLPGAFLVAGDISKNRTRFLKFNCEKQGVGFVNCLRYDAGIDLPFSDNSFDSVLVDAPCSGTGTIRHNPEIRYRIAPADIDRSAARQLKFLHNAARITADGGRLIYSTCSLEIEENENVIQRFLVDDDRFAVIKPDVNGRFVTPQGFARTSPARDEMDGFFIAVLEKRS